MKKIFLILAIVTVTGCATHANIEMPIVMQVHNQVYEDKSMSFEILYSQPEPGIFTGGEQQKLMPITQARLSVASAATLKQLPNYIFQQLPSSVVRVDSGDGDLKLVIELYAHHKKGPAYADYEFAKSFGKSLLTLGLGSSEYNIVADFEITYTLYQKEKEIFKKTYRIEESVDHERGKFESHNAVYDFTGQILKKHLILSLNNFFNESVISLSSALTHLSLSLAHDDQVSNETSY